MAIHHMLEEMLNEYIVAAGLQRGQPLFESVNSLGTAVTRRTLNPYNAWAAIRKRSKAAGFLTPVGCHTWRRPASRFTWRTTAGSSTPDRWRDMSLREPRSCNTEQRMKFHSSEWSASGCDIRFLCCVGATARRAPHSPKSSSFARSIRDRRTDFERSCGASAPLPHSTLALSYGQEPAVERTRKAMTRIRITATFPARERAPGAKRAWRSTYCLPSVSPLVREDSILGLLTILLRQQRDRSIASRSDR
jgi:hypothetical protein